MTTLRQFLDRSSETFRLRNYLWTVVKELRKPQYTCGTVAHEGGILRFIHGRLVYLQSLDREAKERWTNFYGLSIPELQELQSIALSRTKQAMVKMPLWKYYSNRLHAEKEAQLAQRDRSARFHRAVGRRRRGLSGDC